MFRRRMNRLGWIDAPRASLAQWDALARFAEETRRGGLTRTVVCGMGGSSLAPQVLATSFSSSSLTVLDSTDPAAVLAIERADIRNTLFVISSKSGTTVETLAFYHYFAARARPEQFVAITDPGTPLETLARERRFRAVFPHPADVGGRYAALTVVGLLPAALMGIDGRVLLERAIRVNAAAEMAAGGELAARAHAGANKLVLRPPPAIASLALWIEQLVAESSGKDGRGVIPVVDDPLGYAGSDAQVVTDFLPDPPDLGAEFFRWEYRAWQLCTVLGVNAFDQPDVEEAKALARAELARSDGGASEPLATLAPEALRRAARPGDYLALLAYLPPRPDVATRLQEVRTVWARALGCATTLGFGPRYLHSTGQLHKGGPNAGLFVVITTDDAEDAAVPELGTTFGRLKRAQARGDIRALLARGRRVAHVHLSRPEDATQLASL